MTDKKKDRDTELDEWLSPLRNSSTPPGAVERWAAAVNSARQTKSFSRWFSPQMAAALLIGFLAGAGVMTLRNPSIAQRDSENHEPSATIEHIYAKAE